MQDESRRRCCQQNWQKGDGSSEYVKSLEDWRHFEDSRDDGGASRSAHTRQIHLLNRTDQGAIQKGLAHVG